MQKNKYKVEKGKMYPMGATPDKEGVNFSLFSQHATGVELLIFNSYKDLSPVMTVNLDPQTNKTYHFWHVYLKGLKPGVYYAYRVDGPQNPEEGHCFNKKKVLLDPFAKGIANTLWNRDDACDGSDNLYTSMRGMVLDTSDYNWEGDEPLNRPINQMIVYELHVRGFTKSPSSKNKNPGTFSGIIEKIPYLKELGINAVEFLPVFEFDKNYTLRIGFDGMPIKDYWGYNTIGYFAPESNYCAQGRKQNHIKEFRDMVKALHKAGIEVILDIIFNHTGEGDHTGPVINFKGIDNSIYYHLKADNKKYYANYSGCGNSVNSNHPIVGNFILRCLEYWVKEMHVDGFRFDQGSILSRGSDGKPMEFPPLLWNIELSETLAKTKLITEAWDASGLYQVGSFSGFRWAEWNDRFRDDVRKFIKGDPGLCKFIAQRISGSPDIYEKTGHLPTNSLNFITSHDGFTLNDLVTYNEKHNLNNGDNNSDGVDFNYSLNCGIEGPTSDKKIDNFRERQLKNFLLILMLSQGIPMITAGDEFRRTQKGNNNAYCQDNEVSWVDWSLLKTNHPLFRFLKLLIDFRKRNSILMRTHYFAGEKNKRNLSDINWHGCKLNGPGFDNPNSRVLSFTLGGYNEGRDIHVILNMEEQSLKFEIPLVKGRDWYLVIDTAKPSPFDIIKLGEEKKIVRNSYTVIPHSAVVLISK